MKITYHENPFFTTVEPNDNDLWDAFCRIVENEKEDLEYDCTPGTNYRSLILPAEGPERNKRLIDTLKWQIETLRSEPHFGDCVKECISCVRCWAEDAFNVWTLEDFENHASRSWVRSAFNGHSNYEPTVTIDEAIADLDGPYTPPDRSKMRWIGQTDEDWNYHVNRWASERALACENLKTYKATRLSKEEK